MHPVDPQHVHSGIPGEAETREYFQSVGLTLIRLPDQAEESGERWSLHMANGNIHWQQGMSCAPTLSQVWQRWWHRHQKALWLRRCALLFCERQAEAPFEEAREIEEWMKRLGYLPWLERRECWPWTSAYATCPGGGIRLVGWPWLDAPKPGDPMPDPGTWMRAAEAPGLTDTKNPQAFFEDLRQVAEQWKVATRSVSASLDQATATTNR